MPDKLCLKGSRSPLEMARSLAYKMRFRKEHPDFFDPLRPDGLLRPAGLQSPRHESEKGGQIPIKKPVSFDRTGAVKVSTVRKFFLSLAVCPEPHRREPVSCGGFSGKHLPNASILI